MIGVPHREVDTPHGEQRARAVVRSASAVGARSGVWVAARRGRPRASSEGKRVIVRRVRRVHIAVTPADPRFVCRQSETAIAAVRATVYVEHSGLSCGRALSSTTRVMALGAREPRRQRRRRLAFVYGRTLLTRTELARRAMTQLGCRGKYRKNASTGGIKMRGRCGDAQGRCGGDVARCGGCAGRGFLATAETVCGGRRRCACVGTAA